MDSGTRHQYLWHVQYMHNHLYPYSIRQLDIELLACTTVIYRNVHSLDQYTQRIWKQSCAWRERCSNIENRFLEHVCIDMHLDFCVPVY